LVAGDVPFSRIDVAFPFPARDAWLKKKADVGTDSRDIASSSN
jgi:hypothetical protein